MCLRDLREMRETGRCVNVVSFCVDAVALSPPLSVFYGVHAVFSFEPRPGGPHSVLADPRPPQEGSLFRV